MFLSFKKGVTCMKTVTVVALLLTIAYNQRSRMQSENTPQRNSTPRA